MTPTPANVIAIEVAIYRLHVIVTWEPDADVTVRCLRERGIGDGDWVKEFRELQAVATGACVKLGEDNSDVLVWLKRRPGRVADYGVLHHELFHAVDFIAQDHAFSKELEARAYLYEYLVTECYQVLWPDDLPDPVDEPAEVPSPS